MNILKLKYLGRFEWRVVSELNPELSQIFRSSSESKVREWAEIFSSSFNKVTLDLSELDMYIKDRNNKSKEI